jgi:hypothetical protein
MTGQEARADLPPRAVIVPALASYDLILVNISGGKDSQAALDDTVRHAATAEDWAA